MSIVSPLFRALVIVQEMMHASAVDMCFLMTIMMRKCPDGIDKQGKKLPEIRSEGLHSTGNLQKGGKVCSHPRRIQSFYH